jgi:hypothetical protein
MLLEYNPEPVNTMHASSNPKQLIFCTSLVAQRNSPESGRPLPTVFRSKAMLHANKPLTLAIYNSHWHEVVSRTAATPAQESTLR